MSLQAGDFDTSAEPRGQRVRATWSITIHSCRHTWKNAPAIQSRVHPLLKHNANPASFWIVLFPATFTLWAVSSGAKIRQLAADISYIRRRRLMLPALWSVTYFCEKWTAAYHLHILAPLFCRVIREKQHLAGVSYQWHLHAFTSAVLEKCMVCQSYQCQGRRKSSWPMTHERVDLELTYIHNEQWNS